MIPAPARARVGNAALAEGRPPRSVVLFLWAAVPLLVLYASTRARTVTGEDSGELITAAYQLGVAHPPGYPLWVLLTKVFQTVFAGLNPADAAALGSSIMTACAIGLLGLVAFRVTRSVTASLFGAWSIGVGHEIWNHATIAEIYPLSLFLLAASLLLFLRWQEQPTRRRFLAVSLVYGCGLANHPTFHLFLPLFGIAAICAHPRILRDWRAIGLGILGLALPHLAYVETFLAAANDPYLSWGVQPTLRSVLGHYFREIYSRGPEKTAWTATKAFRQLGIYATFFAQNLTILGAVVGFSGLILLVRRNRVFGGLLLALSLLGTIGLLPFIKFDLEREELFATRVFLMPGYLVLGIGLAVATDAAIRTVNARRIRFAPAWTLLVPILGAFLGYGTHDRTGYFWSEDYGRAILAELPKNAILLPGGDTSTFPLLYLQGCLGERKDVVILDRSGTIERKEALALIPERARAAIQASGREELVNAVMTLSGRPVITLRPERAPRELDLVFEPFGLGFMAIPEHDRKAKERVGKSREAFFQKLRLRNETVPTVGDYTADVIKSHLSQARALNYFRSGNPPLALEEAERAAAFAEGIKETLNNIGSMIAENGLPDRSELYFRRALAVRADYQLARQNLALVLRSQEKLDEAFAEAKLGARLDPENPFFFQEATDLAVALKNGDELSELCEARIKAVPSDPAPHRILGEWALEHDHSVAVARLHFEAAVAVDPKDERSQKKLRDLKDESDAPDSLAKAPDTNDPAAEFAALLPKPLSNLRRDFGLTGRARRFGGESGVGEPVAGAADIGSILGQMAPSVHDPLGDLGLPERRPTPVQRQPALPEGSGEEPR